MVIKSYETLRVLVIVLLLISVVLPLATLIFNINPGDISEVVSSPQFSDMLINSVITTSIATIISVTIAFTLAWCVRRTNIKFKSAFSILFTLPMLVPSISHGMGLVLLLGSNSVITRLFGIEIELYGYLGIIIGTVLYSFPVAFLMFSNSFIYEDYTTYEAAQVLGLNKLNQLHTIMLPNMRRTIISAAFAVFTMIFTDYGVPLVIGGTEMTLPVYMYREVIGLLDFSKGAIIAVFLLIPAVIAFLIDLNMNDGGNMSTITKPFVIEKNKRRDMLANIFCIIVVFLISLPFFAFAYLSIVRQYPIDMSFSLDNIIMAFDLGIGMYLQNSIAIALTTALIGVCTIYFTAFITARAKKKFSNSLIHLISMITLAVPGLVLGLCYVLFFKGSLIYGTLAILILVNIVHFFASPYLIAYNTLVKFNSNMEDVSATMGISKMRMLFDVYVPCTRGSIIEMFSYLFVNSMVTISAVSFLANFTNIPIALMIPQFDSQSLIETTAFISIIILIVNCCLKLAVFLVKRYLVKSGEIQ